MCWLQKANANTDQSSPHSCGRVGPLETLTWQHEHLAFANVDVFKLAVLVDDLEQHVALVLEEELLGGLVVVV